MLLHLKDNLSMRVKEVKERVDREKEINSKIAKMQTQWLKRESYSVKIYNEEQADDLNLFQL